MPTLDLKVQGDGRHLEWSSVIGAPFAWQAVDDSATTSHDDDAIHIRIPNLSRASFRVFNQAEHLWPTQVSITIAVKRAQQVHSNILLGFSKNYAEAYHADDIDPDLGSYSVETRTFPTNPLTGEAWTAEDLRDLEPTLSVSTGGQDIFLTLVSVQLVYVPETDYLLPERRRSVTS